MYHFPYLIHLLVTTKSPKALINVNFKFLYFEREESWMRGGGNSKEFRDKYTQYSNFPTKFI